MYVKWRKVIFKLITFICIIGIIYSGYNLINWKKGVDKSKDLKDEGKEAIKVNYDGTYNIDYNKILELNKNAVGYLNVPDTNIDYIVVKGEDNKFYLKHDFSDEYNKTGWIFVDYRNNLDGTDKNIIIYGHNTKDGSMFGNLHKTLKKEWQENNNKNLITFASKTGQYKYLVFSTYMIETEDYYITTNFNSDNDFLNFLNELRNRSNYNYDVILNKEDTILTLSTCSNSGKERVVLHAKRID